MDKRLNILIVISSLKIGGGAEKVAYMLGTELNKKGYNVHFLTFYDMNPKYNVKKEYCLNEKLKSNKVLKLFKRGKEIVNYCNKKKIDVVISFMEESNFPVIMSKFFGNKYKIIPSIHQSPLVYSFLYNFLIKFLYPKADKIITVSKGIENILINHYHIPKEKIKTIYNPHDISKYQQLSKEPLEPKYTDIFKDSFVFINIGRLTEAKGQWFLIRAFRKVTEKYPNAKLIILGDGELRNNLQELINKLNLQNNIYLLGMQKNPLKFLKHSNCFVFSSLWEGFGNVLIEALSLNLPIISTDCKAGPREILALELSLEKKINYPYYGRYGILTKPFTRKIAFKTLKEEPLNKEERKLADLMIKMIENENLRKKYKNGLERAKDFDLEKIILEREKIF